MMIFYTFHGVSLRMRIYIIPPPPHPPKKKNPAFPPRAPREKYYIVQKNALPACGSERKCTSRQKISRSMETGTHTLAATREHPLGRSPTKMSDRRISYGHLLICQTSATAHQTIYLIRDLVILIRIQRA